MPTKHLTFGGSTIARTLACPGWVNLAKLIRALERAEAARGSDAAEEGTALHEAMELIMGDTGVTPDNLAYETLNGVLITPEMVAERLLPAEAAINSLLERHEIADYMIEPFVEIIPDLAGGSIDFLGVSRDGKTVLVVDYKFGYATVSAEENAQLLFYALCGDADPATTDMFKHAEKLVLAVIQPANEDTDGLDVFECPIERLDSFEAEVVKAIHLAQQPDAPVVSGPHCKFCPAEAICPVKTGMAQAARRLPPVQVEKLAEYLPMADELEGWIKAIRKMAHEQLEQGVKIEGFKLVNKRASRVWADQPAAEKKIKNMRGVSIQDAFDMKLKSPAQMEKLFKAKGIAFDKVSDYITSMSSGTTMAPASDKRPEAPSVEAFKAAMQRLPE